MKQTKSLVAILAIGALAAVCGFAQTPEKPTKNPTYDSSLAKKLGADNHGLRQYVMCFLKTGPLKVEDKAKLAELMKGHFGMINRLAAEGKLIVAGPFVDGGDFRGVYLLDVRTIEEAKALTESDPSIKEGYFRVEFIKWRASAALLEVNRIHKTITEDNP